MQSQLLASEQLQRDTLQSISQLQTDKQNLQSSRYQESDSDAELRRRKKGKTGRPILLYQCISTIIQLSQAFSLVNSKPYAGLIKTPESATSTNGQFSRRSPLLEIDSNSLVLETSLKMATKRFNQPSSRPIFMLATIFSHVCYRRQKIISAI